MSATDVRAMRLFTRLLDEMNSALPEAHRVAMKAHKRWATLRLPADSGLTFEGQPVRLGNSGEEGAGIGFGAAGTRVGARFRVLPRRRRAVPDAIRLAESVLSVAYPSSPSERPHKLISRDADVDDRTRFGVNARVLVDAVYISWSGPPGNARTELGPLPLSLF
jgi:hypothetical protein